MITATNKLIKDTIKNPHVQPHNRSQKLTPLMQQYVDKVWQNKYVHKYFNFSENDLEQLPVVAIDLETPYIDSDQWSFDCKPTMWSYFTEDKSVIDRVSYLTGSRDMVFIYDEGKHREAIQFLLDTCTTVYHNSNFDLQRLYQNNYDIPRPGSYQDTMIMANSLNYRQRFGGLSLSLLSSMVGEKKVEIEDKSKFNDIFDKDVYERNLSDTRITYKLYYYLRQELLNDQRAYYHYKYIDLPYTALIREMEDTGLYVDDSSLKEMEAELTTRLNELNHEVKTKYTEVKTKVELKKALLKSLQRKHDRVEPLFCDTGIADNTKFKPIHGGYAYQVIVPFNPNSKQHCLEALQNEGWVYQDDPETVYTKTGQPSIDKDSLRRLASKYPIAKLFDEINRCTKLISSFVEPFQQYGELQDNGLIHLRGQFNQCVAVTGRLSSSNPNLQNIPSRGDLGKRLRSMFVPKPGYTMCIGDDGQIESRIFADYVARNCNDWNLVELFRDPSKDFHMINAINWGFVRLAIELKHPEWSSDKVEKFHDDLIAKYYSGEYTKDNNYYLKSGRNFAKTTIYAILYGAGATKIGGGDVELGKKIIATMDREAPAINQIKQKVWLHCERLLGYAYTQFGRRLIYKDILSEDNAKSSRAQRQVFNALIQGTSADRMKTRMILGYHYLKDSGGHLAAAVHDEYIFYVPKGFGDYVCKKLSAVFSEPGSLLDCPVEFEFQPCQSWADK